MSSQLVEVTRLRKPALEAVFRRVDRHGNIGADRLTGKSIAVTVKNYMAAIGKDPASYAGHSLRAGFATAAARAARKSGTSCARRATGPSSR
jgi:hypothetical protein